MKGSEKGRKLAPFFTEESFTILLEHTNKMKHKVAFLLAFESGLRIAEVLNVKKEDFNFQDNTIFIRQGKNSKDRVVNLPRDWKEHLINFIPIDIVARSLQEALYGAVKRANIDKEGYQRLHFHSLRHGYATHLIEEKQQPIVKVSQMLGHQDVSTTMIYTHMKPKRTANQMRDNF